MTVEVKDVNNMSSCSESRRSAKSSQSMSHSCVLRYTEREKKRGQC